MEHQELTWSSPMSVIARLDRLDRMILDLEENQSSSRRYSCSLTGSVEQALCEKQNKPLACILKEVASKGSLMERVTMLEDRVLQLSLDSGRLSCPNMLSVPENSKCTSPEKESGESSEPYVGEDGKEVAEVSSFRREYKKRNKSSRVHSVLRYRKWLGWIRMGC